VKLVSSEIIVAALVIPNVVDLAISRVAIVGKVCLALSVTFVRKQNGRVNINETLISGGKGATLK